MIYVGTSVLLARFLAEDRFPADDFWRQGPVSSRLLEYETWTRVHARKLGRTHAGAARDLLARPAFVELTPTVLARTLDALRLASAYFLKSRDRKPSFATYDDSLAGAAKALGLKVVVP